MWGAPSAWRKNLFAMLRHFSELQKALKNGDHHRAGHPSRVSRTHPSSPLTKGSHFLTGSVAAPVGRPLSFTTKLSSPSVMRMWKNMENDKESAKK